MNNFLEGTNSQLLELSLPSNINSNCEIEV